jgi:hypothetical protein
MNQRCGVQGARYGGSFGLCLGMHEPSFSTEAQKMVIFMVLRKSLKKKSLKFTDSSIKNLELIMPKI